jgi:hypothetical protein
MTIGPLSDLVAVVLAGSLVMERGVAIVKTLAPKVFGDPGPDPEAIFKPDPKLDRPQRVDPRRKVMGVRWYHGRRAVVLILVLIMSGLIAYLLSENQRVTYGTAGSMHWIMFAFLISGGSAFWAQLLGFVSAVKDFRVEQGKKTTDAANGVIVVNTADTPRLERPSPPKPRIEGAEQ